MTSAHSMQTGARRTGAKFIALATCIVVSSLALASCTSEPKLIQPSTLASPYDQRQVWAVVPFTNESGVSIVAGDRVADAFVAEAEAIDGIDTLPVNRVIAAMRRLGLETVTTPDQAQSLLRALGADGLIAGTVTAYDPYQPPTFGAAVALFTSDARSSASIDPIEVTRARTETVAMSAMSSSTPVAQASGIFDASNHLTLAQLGEYAAGRSEPSSAFESRIYLVRMDLYTQFAAYRLLQDLLDSERARLLPMNADASEGLEEPDSSR